MHQGQQRPLGEASPSARHTCRPTCHRRRGSASLQPGRGRGWKSWPRRSAPALAPPPNSGGGSAFPPAVAKVTMTSPRLPGSECSGGGGRCWETPGRRAARGGLRATDTGRQYALSWPALAPSLPPQFQKDAGFRSSPKSRLRPGPTCRPGASSLLVTVCHTACVLSLSTSPHLHRHHPASGPHPSPFRRPLPEPLRWSSCLPPGCPYSLPSTW